jgi:hypothetical protein
VTFNITPKVVSSNLTPATILGFTGRAQAPGLFYFRSISEGNSGNRERPVRLISDIAFVLIEGHPETLCLVRVGTTRCYAPGSGREMPDSDFRTELVRADT